MESFIYHVIIAPIIIIASTMIIIIIGLVIISPIVLVFKFNYSGAWLLFEWPIAIVVAHISSLTGDC